MSWRKSGCLFSQTILGINEEEVYCYQFSRTRVMYRTVVGTKGIVDKPYHGTMGKNFEARLRRKVVISEHQYSFIHGKSTTDSMFALIM